MREYTVKIKPLTPIWTGDENGKNTTLRETGIIGSLRWWYEALIRGLGGTACDPTNTECKEENHCDACELFGCTGWARKFRLKVEKLNNDIILQFIELRMIKDIEWGLLNKTLTIISEYGSLGGKIAESDYGLIKIEKNDLDKFPLDKIRLKEYLKKQGNGIENPNITRFVFINKNLEYRVVKDLKSKLLFLKGKSGRARRYFYKIYKKRPYRFFAYAKNDKEEYIQLIKFLKGKSVPFIKGNKLLGEESK